MQLLPAVIGAAFIVGGSVLPLVRRDFPFGIRTPWARATKKVWARTHRFAGVVMPTAGVVMILSALVFPADLAIAATIGAGVAAVVAPVVYSYLTWKRDGKR